MKNPQLFALLVLLAVGCRAGDAITLKLAPKEGDSFDYEMVVEASGSQQSNTRVQLSMTVDKVENGKVTLTSKAESATKDGIQIPPVQLAGGESTRVMDQSGKVISESGGSVTQAMSAVFPTKPVAPGDTWEAESNLSGTPGKATFRYIGNETVNGVRSAHIEINAPLPEDSKMDKPVQYWVEIANGMLVKLDMKVDQQSNPSNSMHMSLTRR